MTKQDEKGKGARGESEGKSGRMLFDDNKIKMARKPGKKQGKSGMELLFLFDDNNCHQSDVVFVLVR